MMLRHAYRDPRFVILSLLLIVVSGVAGFLTRPRLEDPTSEVRWGHIATYWPGGSPEEVESRISEPLEKALEEVKTIRTIESFSLRGASLLFAALTDDVTDAADSWVQVQDKLSQAAAELPDGAGSPTLITQRRWDPCTTLVAVSGKPGEHPPLDVLARWGRELENRLRFVPGTRFTELFGLPEVEVIVDARPEQLAAARLTVSEIARAIDQRDSREPDALSRTSNFDMPVRLAGDVDNLDHLRNVTVAATGEGQLRLRDIATVRRGEREPASALAYVGGRRAIVVACTMTEGHSIDAWTVRQREALEQVEAILPDTLEIKLLFSQKRYTDQRSHSLYASLGMGMALVVVVVWFMMGWRAAIPICLALPLTLLTVFFLMIPFGISLHQMSLTGMILALGMLIDNPIIVVDHMLRRREAGEGPEQALVTSIRHLMTPLLGSNVTTILGFLPILMIPGPTGEYLGQFAWSTIACLSVSLLLSLTLIPVIAAWCLRGASSVPVAKGSFRERYRILQRGIAARPRLTLLVSGLLPALGFVLASDLHEQFFPPAERDQFHFSLRLPSYTSIDRTARVAAQARDLILRHDQVRDVTLFVGTNAPKIHYSMLTADENRSSFAQGIVQLHEKRVPVELVNTIQQELDEAFPEAQSLVTLLNQGPPTAAPIEYRLYGPSLEQLNLLGEEARRILAGVAGVAHVRASLDPGGPRYAVHLSQQHAESAGLSDARVARQLRNQLQGLVVTTMTEGTEKVPVRVRVEQGAARSCESVFSLPILSEQGEVVPLGSLAEATIEPQRFCISRRNSSRCNVVYGYVSAGQLPIVVEDAFQRALEENGFSLPPGYRAEFGGVSHERNAAVGNLLAYAAIFAVLMFSVTVVTFRSFRLAAVVGMVGVLSIGMGLLSLWLFRYPLGIVSIVGMLGMVGLAINDSIVVLADARQASADGTSLVASVMGSTRHVLTTSITTVAGVLPLILAGGDFWPPMMIVIAGGVVGATSLALAFTPAAYRFLMGKKSGDD